ncbi:Hypothetical predicted protein [Pelobates cultripes]|uniref:Uncharacterized protein n=1 Tax=Pelobates cultripes TaxID=61616 RepID=A0AAD1SVP7_PELCU|nr:Hypothetical predicted protein [Pelobates cultripes]
MADAEAPATRDLTLCCADSCHILFDLEVIFVRFWATLEERMRLAHPAVTQHQERWPVGTLAHRTTKRAAVPSTPNAPTVR